jgi:hypothetical protein
VAFDRCRIDLVLYVKKGLRLRGFGARYCDDNTSLFNGPTKLGTVLRKAHLDGINKLRNTIGIISPTYRIILRSIT